MFSQIAGLLSDPYLTRSMYHSALGLLLGAGMTEYALQRMGL